MIPSLLLSVAVSSSSVGQAFRFPGWVNGSLSGAGQHLNVTETELTKDSGRACYSILDGWVEREMCLNSGEWGGDMKSANCYELPVFATASSRNWEELLGSTGKYIAISNASEVLGYIVGNLDDSDFLLCGTGDMTEIGWTERGSPRAEAFNGSLVATDETAVETPGGTIGTRMAYGNPNDLLSGVFSAAGVLPLYSQATKTTSAWPYDHVYDFNSSAYSDGTADCTTFDSHLDKRAWNAARAVLPMMGDILKTCGTYSVMSNVHKRAYSTAKVYGTWSGVAGPAWDQLRGKWVLTRPNLSQLTSTDSVTTSHSNINVSCSSVAIFDMQNSTCSASTLFACTSSGTVGEFPTDRSVDETFCVCTGVRFDDSGGDHRILASFDSYRNREDPSGCLPLTEYTEEPGSYILSLLMAEKISAFENDITITNATASANATFERLAECVMPEGGYFTEDELPPASLQQWYGSTLEYANVLNADWYRNGKSEFSPYQPLSTTFEDDATNFQWRCGSKSNVGVSRSSLRRELFANAKECSDRINSIFNSERGSNIENFIRVNEGDARAYWNALAQTMATNEYQEATSISRVDCLYVFSADAGAPPGLYVRSPDDNLYRQVDPNTGIFYTSTTVVASPQFFPEPHDRGYDNRCWFHGVGSWSHALRMIMDWKNYKATVD